MFMWSQQDTSVVFGRAPCEGAAPWRKNPGAFETNAVKGYNGAFIQNNKKQYLTTFCMLHLQTLSTAHSLQLLLPLSPSTPLHWVWLQSLKQPAALPCSDFHWVQRHRNHNYWSESYPAADNITLDKNEERNLVCFFFLIHQYLFTLSHWLLQDEQWFCFTLLQESLRMYKIYIKSGL